MRSGKHRYPVDRYLVENNKKIEMVNIIDDEIWNPEPALRPEDEIILRKLHDMLQSTTDNLKLLSGELSKYHETGVQVKTVPTPLDEEFNEKVHIEEVVNAKFHGYKIVDKSSPCVPENKPCNDVFYGIMPVVNSSQKPKISKSAVQINPTPILKKSVVNRNLGITHPKIIQINNKNHDSKNNVTLNNGKVINITPAVAYNEFSYEYVEPKKKQILPKPLQTQQMPSINIRSELKEQKVLSLDILPESNDNKDMGIVKSNVAVVSMQYETVPKDAPNKMNKLVQYQPSNCNIPPTRKISKMSTCESSGSTNNISSDTQIKLKTQKRINTVLRYSPKMSARFDRSKKSVVSKKESEKRPCLNLDEWKKKINVVYGPSSSKKKKDVTVKNAPPKKSNSALKQSSVFNNAEYIPYSKLTLGGVRVSDIEREISDIPNKNELPLSPILDRILSSRENSFSKNSPRKHKPIDSTKILTTSDENLLQEVIDIEKTVSETLSNNLQKKMNKLIIKSENNSNGDVGENESYIDDFENEKSDHTGCSENQKLFSDTKSNDQQSNKSSPNELHPVSSSDDDDYDLEDGKPGTFISKKLQNATFTKTSNLSFKDSVDIFEFVHLIDTQDTATQSNVSSKIVPKETQTSPINDRPNIQPIHNDLWPSIDPRGEVENMFKSEKEIIKKLIIEEYGGILDTFTKPTTSNVKIEFSEKNIAASQKHTQTSPAHVKSVMTSPTRTKTRTTSPFALSLPVDHQTSPLIIETTEPKHKIENKNDPEDLGISINLSSPRFSLRLPQNSCEVLSNLGRSQTQLKINMREHNKTFRKSTINNSSSADADYSSSEVSSLGEVKLKRRFRKRNPSISEYSSSSSLSKFSYNLQSVGILPLRSEGEISLGHGTKTERPSKSNGETSFGLLK